MSWARAPGSEPVRATLVSQPLSVRLRPPAAHTIASDTLDSIPANELPPPVQQKLVSLQTKLAVAQAAKNTHDQADALNQIGDLYWGVSEYDYERRAQHLRTPMV